MRTYVAVDLGATSGRVIAGRVEGGRLVTEETGRFPNVPVSAPGPGGRATLHWDVLRLWAGVQDGLAAAARRFGAVTSVGIDGWAVDHGLLDADGALLGNPVHYRDPRTADAPRRLFERITPERHYALTGVQLQPFNTVFQLVAAAGTAQLAAARRALLIPDLLASWLTGEQVAELTNASTTGLLDATTRTWSTEVTAAASALAGVDVAALLPRLVAPGSVVGAVRPEVGRALGLDGTTVVAVGSHDTASAVAAVPVAGRDAAWISSGTWSLVGLELDAPVLTEASRAANFTNELGVHGTVRYLRNVTGLWLLEQALATWAAQGRPQELEPLLRQAADVPGLRCVVDVDDPAFAAPGDVPARIADVARATGQPAPSGPAEVVRVVLDSLALAHARAVRQAAGLAGRDVAVVHLVGGGARNALLCRLTADATGLPVEAGPAEGTATGNLLVQAAAAGDVGDDLAAMRAVVRASTPTRRYEPSGDHAAWARAEKSLRG
ncbi:rhamnulokinase [Cellulomonas cellasea]|uniref:Carbohydrate kinase n=2 Tax=Cellulomonas cellasea TaxID=43670 RepID=A0A4Y3KWV4_9CELL|nr:rhamnulokinase family protein [Cellulomonas cellasea]GEA88869.1 carbohydrate kinase [Cellulomonas cellasea]